MEVDRMKGIVLLSLAGLTLITATAFAQAAEESPCRRDCTPQCLPGPCLRLPLESAGATYFSRTCGVCLPGGEGAVVYHRPCQWRLPGGGARNSFTARVNCVCPMAPGRRFFTARANCACRQAMGPCFSVGRCRCPVLAVWDRHSSPGHRRPLAPQRRTRPRPLPLPRAEAGRSHAGVARFGTARPTIRPGPPSFFRDEQRTPGPGKPKSPAPHWPVRDYAVPGCPR